MEILTKKYYQYDLNYYLQPGNWMDKCSLELVIEQLEKVRDLSGESLNYGILDQNLSEDEKVNFLKNANICILKDRGEPIGFFYNLVLRERPVPVIHAGLIVLAKNQGYDLIGYPYSFMTYLQFKKYGVHFYTNISSTPSIIGVFSDSFSGVWPSYKANQIKPPTKEYVPILGVLQEKYIKKYFKMNQCEVDKKRFVLRSGSKEMGFETDMKKLSRYHKPEVNYFCMFWLDYAKGEDLIQIGKVDLRAVIKIKLFYFFKKIRSFFVKIPTSRVSL